MKVSYSIKHSPSDQREENPVPLAGGAEHSISGVLVSHSVQVGLHDAIDKAEIPPTHIITSIHAFRLS